MLNISLNPLPNQKYYISLRYQNDIKLLIIKNYKVMETKEFEFKGSVLNGFLMLFLNIAVIILAIVGIVYSIIMLDGSNGAQGGWLLGGSLLLIIVNIIMWCGMMQLEPNEARVTTWFGKYAGTFSETGFFSSCLIFSVNFIYYSP